MKIERIHVDGFGRLRDFDSGPEALGRLVVVLGPNEAGKSTLFSFLTTALYGFSPASRESNPHIPWGTNEAGGRIQLRTADDPCLMVHRRLRSSPTGTLTRGETTLDLRNQPLDFVRHVPRTVFRQVFALTLAELAGLDDDTWGRIQDRVLVSMGASDLSSARDVADELEREAGEIWRPNRRGNQRLRDVRDEMRALRGLRSEAITRDREIRALIEERESVALRLDDVRRELKRDRIVVERIRELLPLKRQLDRVEALRLDGGSRAELEGFPSDLDDRLTALSADADRLRGRLTAIDSDLVVPQSTIERFSPEMRTLLGRADDVERFLRGPDAGTAGAARMAELQRDEATARLQVDTAVSQLFETPLDDARRERLATMSTDLLRDRIERLAQSRQRDSDEGTSASSRRFPGIPAWVGGACIAAGSALLVWGVIAGLAWIAGSGAGLLAAGLQLSRTRRARPTQPDVNADGSTRLVREINSMIGGMDFRPEYLSPPGLPLASSIERLRDQLIELETTIRAREELEQQRHARTEAARALAEALGRPRPDDIGNFERLLDGDLRDAERTRDAATHAEGERERLRRTRATIASDLDHLDVDRDALVTRVADLAGDTGRRAIESIQLRIDAHVRADRIEEELERTHPNLVDLRARIEAVDASGASWSVTEDEVTDRRVRIEEAEQRVEELVGRLGELERDVVHLRDQDTVDTIDGAIEALREEDAKLVAERDRKWVLARLIREADRRFREEHQPDLLRRASDYLRRLTDGRYERLLVDERADGDLFHLVGPALPSPVPLAAPISTGTLEQAYLALRLAIVDHLDRDRERLPLFIDEAFVNWDATRRDRGLEVLAEVSKMRQVFAFTCHPDMADRLVAHGGRMIRLAR